MWKDSLINTERSFEMGKLRIFGSFTGMLLCPFDLPFRNERINVDTK